MPLTAQQFEDWLYSTSAIKCILAEVTVNINGTETVLYLSNRNYITSSADTPSNTTYLPVLKTTVQFTESLNFQGDGASLSFGDIAIDNTNGERDAWLNYVWATRPIKIYLGDPRFSRDNFTLIFSGIISDISSSDRNTININLRDLLQRLNNPITDTVLGNYYQGNIVSTSIYDNPNKDQVLPLVFGEVNNITPLLMDASTLEFMVHNGPIEGIIEVRDNGIPVSFTANNALGTFKLNKPSVGTVTCSVQGDKNTVWNTTVATIIKRILTGYGRPDSRIVVTADLNTTELDDTNFTTFDSNNTQKVGVYINSKENLLAVCQQLATSVGAQLVSSRTGVLKLLKVDVPALPASYVTITDNFILQNSLQISQKTEPVASIKLNYCKNWTLQDKLQNGLPQAHKDLYAKEWLNKTVRDQTVATLYKIMTEPEPKDTLLLTDSTGQVTAECTRLLTLYKTSRYIYRMQCTSSMFNVKLGDIIRLNHRRFNLTNVAAQVLSCSVDWDTGFITLEVLV